MPSHLALLTNLAWPAVRPLSLTFLTSTFDFLHYLLVACLVLSNDFFFLLLSNDQHCACFSFYDPFFDFSSGSTISLSLLRLSVRTHDTDQVLLLVCFLDYLLLMM